MKRSILVAGSICLATPAGALAKAPSREHVREYKHLYSQVRSEFGKRAPGCNLVGARGSCHTVVTDTKLVKSIGVLDRMVTPVVQPVIMSTVTSTVPIQNSYVAAPGSPYTAISSTGSCGGITPYSGGGQCWAIPYGIVQCESGGQNVPNSTGSGANGYYQLMIGGTGSRSEQDQAAASLWNGGAGASNWVCKG